MFVLFCLIGTLALMSAEDRLVELGAHPALRQPQRRLELLAWALLALLAGRALRRPTGFVRPAAADGLFGATATVLLVDAAAQVLNGGEPWRPLSMLPVLAGLVALSRVGERRILQVVVMLLAASLGGSVAVALVGVGNTDGAGRLSWGLLAGWRAVGLFPWAIDLGAAAGLAVVVAGAALTARTIGMWTGGAMVALGLATVVMADAATAAGALLVALVVVAVVRSGTVLLPRGAARVERAMRGGAAVPLAGLLAAVSFAFPFVVGRWGERFGVSLTGRVQAWRRVLEHLTPRQALLGIGDQPLQTERAFLTDVAGAWTPIQSHSTPFELYLTAGVVGGAAYLWLASVLILAALRTLGRSHGWSLALVAYTLVVWSTEEYLMNPRPSDLFLLSCLLIVMLGWLRHDPAVESAVASTQQGSSYRGSSGWATLRRR